MEKQVIVLTAMHGRHETVAKCYNKMKHLPITFIYGYTLPSDGEFLDDLLDEGATYKAPNTPLWQKFQLGVGLAKKLKFDIAIMLGSDDYIDEKFLDFVCEQTEHYDFIGFNDIYFEEKDKRYYWSGYTNNRQGEPCGAGKVYTRKALEMLDWNLYARSIDRGLDHHAYKRVKRFGLKCLVTSIKHHGLTLVDVKDSGSLTPLAAFNKTLQEI